MKTAYSFSKMFSGFLAQRFCSSSAHNLLLLYETLSKPLGISLLQGSSFQNREKKTKSLPAFILLNENCKSRVNATKYQCLPPALFGVTLAVPGVVGMELILVTAAETMLCFRCETKAGLITELAQPQGLPCFSLRPQEKAGLGRRERPRPGQQPRQWPKRFSVLLNIMPSSKTGGGGGGVSKQAITQRLSGHRLLVGGGEWCLRISCLVSFSFLCYQTLLTSAHRVFLASAPLILSPTLLGGSHLPAGIHPSHSSGTSGKEQCPKHSFLLNSWSIIWLLSLSHKWTPSLHFL